MIMVETKNLEKIYGKDETKVKALNNINLSIKKGEFIGIVGTSGSGKSTLLHILGGLDKPTNGEVIIDGTNIFIFQNYNLVPTLNSYENIILPIQLDGNSVDTKFIDEISKILGLENKLESLPNNLSGGQQQRVAIARALATKLSIILADEPTGNLDSKTSKDVLNLLKIRRIKQSIF